jgi:hypothetical protein
LSESRRVKLGGGGLGVEVLFSVLVWGSVVVVLVVAVLEEDVVPMR